MKTTRCIGYIECRFQNKQGKSCVENLARGVEMEEKTGVEVIIRRVLEWIFTVAVPVCWLLRISVPINESPMIQSDPLALHLSIMLMAKQFLTVLFTILFRTDIRSSQHRGDIRRICSNIHPSRSYGRTFLKPFKIALELQKWTHEFISSMIDMILGYPTHPFPR